MRALGLARGSWYYEPAGETAANLKLMRRMDKLYLKRPYFGSRRMALEFDVNRKRIQRLMQIMGLEAIYPKPRTTVRCPEHKIYPYLLRNVEIERPNHVWSTDITYIPLKGSYVYLTAVIDWYSRYVLSWRLSNTLDGAFCIAALEEALVASEPEIFNTDQGVQFTSLAFTSFWSARRGDQHGRPRSGLGQRVRGTIMADGEVRRGVLEGLRERLAGRDKPA